ncbi:MAG: selenide, water dikinase SelD [Gammaproteobacteria bacterium]|nr:MAG: selenide, water dikinase SelD [Gammaproteobacteria bacterium]
MNALLETLPVGTDPNLIVGYDTSDDAGVYRLSETQAIVVTADFITPPTDDPETFGRVAAANAISDVYAMGGRPLTCVNLVAFPSKKLPTETLAGIIRGAQEKIAESGAVLAGGHTVEDPEPKFGLAVTGIVHPDRVWTNSGARVGDVLVLTKPIGSGVLLNANLKGWVDENDLTACLATLETLNRRAAEIAGAYEIHAATDVTGFGLAGHALEMARGANVCIHLDSDSVPVLSGARAMYDRGMSTGSNETNEALVLPHLTWRGTISTTDQSLFFDPQTNGGLLFALDADAAPGLVQALVSGGVSSAAVIGSVAERSEEDYLEIG